MATDYTLTLPKGKITRNAQGQFRGQLFTSSKNHFSPQNPASAGGWKKDDTLTVTATFDTDLLIDPSTGKAYPSNDQPVPSDYYGLSVDALYNPSKAQITSAENALKSQSAGIVGAGIRKSGDTVNNNTDIFINAASKKATITLVPSSRGSFTVVYKWTMDFNDSFNNNGAGSVDTSEIELIFGYGDPMLSESMT